MKKISLILYLLLFPLSGLMAADSKTDGPQTRNGTKSTLVNIINKGPITSTQGPSRVHNKNQNGSAYKSKQVKAKGSSNKTNGNNNSNDWLWKGLFLITLTALLLVLWKNYKNKKSDSNLSQTTTQADGANIPQTTNKLSESPSTNQEPGEVILHNDEPLVDVFKDNAACMAVKVDNWIVVGASVQGNSHVKMDIPCQDNHAYEYLSKGWGIAITSDGAGSARLSHKGSAAVVARAMFHFKELIEKEGWMNCNALPTDRDWMIKSVRCLKRVHDDIDRLAVHLSCEPKDLNATVIVVIHSPIGLLTVHVGDGRAGYKDCQGQWHPAITPHKGEEANQTVFLQSPFWNIPFFEMSGVLVPESVVVREPIIAFTLMSDGCESTSWLCNQPNQETGKYYDPNMPFNKFFDPLIENLCSFSENQVSLEKLKNNWYGFIKEGNKSFIKETDDKTMILATLYQTTK